MLHCWASRENIPSSSIFSISACHFSLIFCRIFHTLLWKIDLFYFKFSVLHKYKMSYVHVSANTSSWKCTSWCMIVNLTIFPFVCCIVLTEIFSFMGFFLWILLFHVLAWTSKGCYSIFRILPNWIINLPFLHIRFWNVLKALGPNPIPVWPLFFACDPNISEESGLASWKTVSGRRPVQQSMCKADIIFQDGVKKKRKEGDVLLLLWFLTLEGGEKWQVAVWSVCFIYMRNKNQSLSSIYSCCDINDAMHYSHTVCTFTFGGNRRVNIYSVSNWRLSIFKTSRKNTRNARCQRTLCS